MSTATTTTTRTTRNDRIIPALQSRGYTFVRDAERNRALRLPFASTLVEGRCGACNSQPLSVQCYERRGAVQPVLVCNVCGHQAMTTAPSAPTAPSEETA